MSSWEACIHAYALLLYFLQRWRRESFPSCFLVLIWWCQQDRLYGNNFSQTAIRSIAMAVKENHSVTHFQSVLLSMSLADLLSHSFAVYMFYSCKAHLGVVVMSQDSQQQYRRWHGGLHCRHDRGKFVSLLALVSFGKDMRERIEKHDYESLHLEGIEIRELGEKMIVTIRWIHMKAAWECNLG